MALSNRASWQRSIFHISDAQGKHELKASSLTVAQVDDLWPLIEPRPRLVPCLELHLDLNAQDCLSGPYDTPHGEQFELSDAKPDLTSLAMLVGQRVDLQRRLELAGVIAASVRSLYDTPFLDSACDKTDLGFLVRRGQTLNKLPVRCPVYLKRELAAVPAMVMCVTSLQ